jgi:hypothetical protein
VRIWPGYTRGTNESEYDDYRSIYGNDQEGSLVDTQIAFDRQDQLQLIQSGLLSDERLFAVYDEKGFGTGFVAVTDRRLLLQNPSFIHLGTGRKKVATISLPYSRIVEVGLLSDRSIFGTFFSSAEVYVRTSAGDVHAAVLRSPDKARYVHDVVLHYITDTHKVGSNATG